MQWPWPADSPAQRAKRVALSYRHLLTQIIAGDVYSPAVALDALDERWTDLGAGWVKPSNAPLRLDDWLTANEMAELFHVTSKMVYNWGYRGHIEVEIIGGQRRYRVGDVVDYQRVLVQERLSRHTSPVSSDR